MLPGMKCRFCATFIELSSVSSCLLAVDSSSLIPRACFTSSDFLFSSLFSIVYRVPNMKPLLRHQSMSCYLFSSSIIILGFVLFVIGSFYVGKCIWIGVPAISSSWMLGLQDCTSPYLFFKEQKFLDFKVILGFDFEIFLMSETCYPVS